MASPQVLKNSFPDTKQGGANVAQGCFAFGDGQIGEVDVDRQPGHVAKEQVDCRAPFECETLLGCDRRQGPHKEAHLLAENRVVTHVQRLLEW